jgi:hypothetical protein
MNDQVLMNDAAARSPTGEILDQAPSPTSTQTSTTPETGSDPTKTPDSPASSDASQPSADPKPAAEVKDPAAKDPPSGVPEKYEFKAPDNYTLDPAAYEAALPIFKELGLTNDQAQKLIDIQVQRELALAKAPQDAVETMRKDWRGKAEADPDIKATVDKNSGKTGMDAVKINIARVFNVLPQDLQGELRDAMNLTGAGDHPAMIKAFNKLSAFITEGSHVAGANPSALGQTKPGTNTRPTAAEAMYPNLARG